MSDRASKIIASGDAEAILKMAMGAWFAADEGRFCECEEPSLYGYDLMCGNCLLENQQQIERRTALIRGPHAFEPNPRLRNSDYWCAICSMPKVDPRHDEGRAA